MLSEEEWEQFFDLLNKIVDGDASYQEKMREVKRRAEDNGAEMNLEEFASWFVE